MIHTFRKKGVSRNWGARNIQKYPFENPKYPFDAIFLYITHAKSPLKGSPIYSLKGIPIYPLKCPVYYSFHRARPGCRALDAGRWQDAGGGRGAAVGEAVAWGPLCAHGMT